MSSVLTRDDIIDGIRDVIVRLRQAGRTATIQIVGGAAIALTIDGDRPATADVDGPVTPFHDVEAVAVQVAKERGWPLNWVNDRAKISLPDGIARGIEWVTLHDRDGILIQAASPAMLLAMKLRAMERRGLRDIDDVAALLAVTGIGTPDEAEVVLNEFFPGEDLSPRTYDRVTKLLEAGLPPIAPPPPPDFR